MLTSTANAPALVVQGSTTAGDTAQPANGMTMSKGRRTGAAINLLTGGMQKEHILLARKLEGWTIFSSKDASVRAFTQNECSECCGRKNPPRRSDKDFRSEIFAFTNVYTKQIPIVSSMAGLSIFTQSEKRIFVLRDWAMSSFDPIAAALESLA